MVFFKAIYFNVTRAVSIKDDMKIRIFNKKRNRNRKGKTCLGKGGKGIPKVKVPDGSQLTKFSKELSEIVRRVGTTNR